MFSFHHVALSVSSLDRSISFYQALGFEQVMHWQAEDGSLQIAQLRLGEALLELFCYAKPTSAPVTSQELATDLPRIGVKHFGLQVADLQQTSVHLVELGMLGDAKITKGRTGIDYLFIRDPDGILLEIVEDKRGV